MKNILIPVGLLAIGGILIASNKKSIKTDLVRKQLKEYIRSITDSDADLQLIGIIDKMTDDEVIFLNDLWIVKKYSQPYPKEVQIKFNSIGEKYNIFT
ncbi:hypothetical protein GOQ30_11285 [Flavobacterium sp. TP390]|uniref:Uncharacterized protein n=1 Tax=Flavobacterium profundi TaxID=1774945 RepID=A0A6I4IM48_9FLAO|nr:hypothetical protein [Flavobacterium profundi]MVO09741.1 hypothetical protein [Flavobacterium profundi]